MSTELSALQAARERRHVICFDPGDDIATVGEFVTLIFENDAGQEVMAQECAIVSVDWLKREYVAVPIGAC
jgi:hypothetical protein